MTEKLRRDNNFSIISGVMLMLIGIALISIGVSIGEPDLPPEDIFNLSVDPSWSVSGVYEDDSFMLLDPIREEILIYRSRDGVRTASVDLSDFDPGILHKDGEMYVVGDTDGKFRWFHPEKNSVFREIDLNEDLENGIYEDFRDGVYVFHVYDWDVEGDLLFIFAAIRESAESTSRAHMLIDMSTVPFSYKILERFGDREDTVVAYSIGNRLISLEDGMVTYLTCGDREEASIISYYPAGDIKTYHTVESGCAYMFDMVTLPFGNVGARTYDKRVRISDHVLSVIRRGEILDIIQRIDGAFELLQIDTRDGSTVRRKLPTTSPHILPLLNQNSDEYLLIEKGNILAWGWQEFGLIRRFDRSKKERENP